MEYNTQVYINFLIWGGGIPLHTMHKDGRGSCGKGISLVYNLYGQ